MTEYKLVPFEPTPEMVEAAEEAHMPFGDMDLALRMAILAAPTVQREPGVKWAPEEVANGNKGIRWVSDEGVHGRPTDHDCRVYLESNPNARGCHCPECTMLYAALQPAEQQPDVTRLVEALEEILSFVVDEPWECRGDKCRELWCISCFGEEEARGSAAKAKQAIHKAVSALAAHRQQEGSHENQ